MDKDIDACLVKKEMFKVDGNSLYQIKEEGDANLAEYRGLGVINGMACYLFATRKKDLAIPDGKAWFVDGVIVSSDGNYHEKTTRFLNKRARDHQIQQVCLFGRPGI